MNIDTVISKMNAKIAEVKQAAEEKRPLLAEEDRLKLDELVAKTKHVVEEASSKISETVHDLNVDETTVSNFLERVSSKCEEACDFTIKKIRSFKNDPEAEAKLKDADKTISDSFDALMDSPEVKSVIEQVRKAGSGVKKTIDEFWNRAETQEEIRKAKKATLAMATKAYEAISKVLNEEVEKVEDLKDDKPSDESKEQSDGPKE